MIKLCKDCISYRAECVSLGEEEGESLEHICQAPQLGVDLVTGAKVTRDARETRDDPTACSVDGKWWVLSPPETDSKPR